MKTEVFPLGDDVDNDNGDRNRLGLAETDHFAILWSLI